MTPYTHNSKLYTDYYTAQVGTGLPVFVGSSIQRGHGVGNILKGLFNAVVPLFSSVGKTLGKQALNTGLQIAGDVVSGHNLKESAKHRAREAGHSLLNKAVHHARKPIKRKKSQKNISRSKVRRRNAFGRDIFRS